MHRYWHRIPGRTRAFLVRIADIAWSALSAVLIGGSLALSVLVLEKCA